MSSTVCCLFCENSSNNIYEINGNSILIEKALIDIDELIYDLFMSRTDSNTTSYICEECKDQLVNFYVFKSNAKKFLPQNTVNVIVQQIYDFCEKHHNKDFDVKCTENEISISVESPVEIEEDYDEIMYMDLDDNEDGDVEEFIQLPPEDIKEEEELNQVSSDEFHDETEIMESPVEIKSVKRELEESFQESKNLQSNVSIVNKKREKQFSPSRQNHSTCCGVQFKEARYLKMHEKAHESFNAVLPYLPWFQCNECKIHFSNAKDLETHKELHENGSTLEEIQLISRPSAFLDHFLKQKFETVDENIDGPTCGHCGKKKSELDMKFHLLFFHTTIIECPLENRIFEGNKQIRLFVEHVKNKHPEIFDKVVEYICTYCKANFPSMFERLAHMKNCDSKKFICTTHCGKRFKSEWLLNKHIQQVEEGDDRFTCNLCGKSCLSKSDLQIHMRSHTNERPYVCSICDKAFKTSANRSSHMDIHREDKIHSCNICNELFQTRPILRKHKKKHDTVYQNQCTCKICKKSYINRTHLLRHLRSAHSKIDLSIDQIDSFFEDYLIEKIKENH